MIRILKLIPILLLIMGCEPENNPTSDPVVELEYRKIAEIRSTSFDNGVPYQKVNYYYEYKEDKPYQIIQSINTNVGGVSQFEYNNEGKLKAIYRLVSLEINSETGQPVEAGTDISTSDALIDIFHYEYDNNNLVKISNESIRSKFTYTIENEDERLISSHQETTQYNNDAIVWDIHYDYNDSGNITVVSRVNVNSSIIDEYQYDDGVNPFYAYYNIFGFVHVPTAGLSDMFASYISPNNIINEWSDVSYDNQGYPKTLEINSSSYFKEKIEFIYK